MSTYSKSSGARSGGSLRLDKLGIVSIFATGKSTGTHTPAHRDSADDCAETDTQSYTRAVVSLTPRGIARKSVEGIQWLG